MNMPPDPMLGVKDDWDKHFHEQGSYMRDYDIFCSGHGLANAVYAYCEVEFTDDVSPIGREIMQNYLRYDKIPTEMRNLVQAENRALSFPGLYTKKILEWSLEIRKAALEYCPEISGKIIEQAVSMNIIERLTRLLWPKGRFQMNDEPVVDEEVVEETEDMAEEEAEEEDAAPAPMPAPVVTPAAPLSLDEMLATGGTNIQTGLMALRQNNSEGAGRGRGFAGSRISCPARR